MARVNEASRQMSGSGLEEDLDLIGQVEDAVYRADEPARIALRFTSSRLAFASDFVSP